MTCACAASYTEDALWTAHESQFTVSLSSKIMKVATADLSIPNVAQVLCHNLQSRHTSRASAL